VEEVPGTGCIQASEEVSFRSLNDRIGKSIAELVPESCMRTALLLLGLLLCLGSAGVAAQAGSASGVQSPGDAVLNPGDVVRVTVFQREEFTGEFEIASDGSIRHPLLRDIRIAGVPLAVAEDRLRSYLLEFESDPRFVIEPLFRVAVGGEVRAPSLYLLTPEMSVVQAVAMAGGASERGRADRVRVFRNGTQFVLDLTDPESRVATTLVQSGDQIVVDRRVEILREYVLPGLTVVGTVAGILNLVLR